MHWQFYRTGNARLRSEQSNKTAKPNVNIGLSSKKTLEDHTRYRGSYFLAWRKERRLMRILMKSPLSFTESKRARTIVRFIYYRILPRWLAIVEYPPDRMDILDIESHYYYWMTIVKLRSSESSKRPNRLAPWLCSLTSPRIHFREVQDCVKTQ